MKKKSVLLILLVLASCSHNPFKKNESISIKLKGLEGYEEKYTVFSQTLVENIKDDQLMNQKIEVVDFDLFNKTTKVNDSGIHISSTTTRKEGSMQLHDMAYPELNERIDFVYNQEGEVLKAGSFLKNSLFFLPPIPLPKKAIRVGDHWDYEGRWTAPSLQGTMKIKLQMELKKILPCFSNEKCVGVQWTGIVNPDQGQKFNLPVESVIQGYALYRPLTGSQLWSYTRNIESFSLQNLKLRVSSCVQSILKSDTSGLNSFVKKDPYCDPSKNELAYFEAPEKY